MFNFLRSSNEPPSTQPGTPPRTPKNSGSALSSQFDAAHIRMEMVDVGGTRPPPNTPNPSTPSKKAPSTLLPPSPPPSTLLGGAPSSPSLRRLSSASASSLTHAHRRIQRLASNVGEGVTYSVEFVSSFWFVVTTITLFTFMFTLFSLVWLNYNEVQHPGQIDLVGTSVSHALTIHSSSTNPSELRFLTGFDRNELMGFRLEEGGEFEMYRAGEEAEEEDGKEERGYSYKADPIFKIDRVGTAVWREDLISKKSLHGAGLYASHDGFHFPDGSVMTTAAETSVGMKSETDLNFIAGDNSTNSEVSASIIMTVGELERMRVKSEGIFFRSQLSSGGQSLENFDEGISLYPDSKTVKLGTLQINSRGLASTDPESEIEFHASSLVLNDTSSSANGATISVSKGLHLATGLPLVMTGQSAVLTGGDTDIRGGHGVSHGGNVIVDGGRSDSRHGDVILGAKSYRTLLNSNRTEINARAHLRITSSMVDVQSPIVFNSPSTSFSSSAFKLGASFSSYATVTTTNVTIAQSPIRSYFFAIEGHLRTAHAFPETGGVWGVAESCTTCVKFGPAGGFHDRHGMLNMLVEGITVQPFDAGHQSNNDVINYTILKRISVTCAVVKTDNNYVDQLTDISYDNPKVLVIASVSFFDGDEFVSLSGSRSSLIEGAQEYGIYCRAHVKGGGSDSEDVAVSASVVTLGMML
ncbi:hypothetical protein TrVE_jg2173 [Triparma verrucosa]|uniref:Uncharacterized protein n=1 Tax=Triparma verrucosa TaxID=1606542 RepID=A0A9W7KX02_9STRA|nr:hypothetical protein TrVE_jg2173 [Triparma verrucosa]